MTFPGGGTTAALATPHLLAAAATAAAASSALGGDGGAGLCGVSSSTIFPDAYPDVALVFFRLDGGCQKVFVESAARLHARGSTWWFDPTRGFPARPFGTTFTAVIRRVGRRPDSGRFVGSDGRDLGLPRFPVPRLRERVLDPSIGSSKISFDQTDGSTRYLHT